MHFQVKQLNKMTLVKALTALIIIVAVLAVGVACMVFAATSAINNGALNAYESWGEIITADVRNSIEQREITLSTSMTESEYAALFENGDRGFQGVGIATSSRHVIYDSQGFLNELIPSNIEMPREGVSVGVAQFGEQYYVISVSCVEGEYFAVGYIDFTANVKAISGMQTSVIAIGVLSALFVVGAFVAFVITTGLNERGHRYKYKLVTDGEGKIINSNKAFKEDFPQTIRLYENVSHFADHRLTAIKIPYFEDEIFVACAAKKTTNGRIRISADPLTMPFNSEATQPRDMMREVYNTLMPKGKPFLIGVINFMDLPNINAMFGKEFTESVHNILYERIARRFTYLYALDLYNIGVLFPGGKEYSNLLQDLREVVDSFNQPLKIEENLINVKVKCGFAICDGSMPQRSFEYAMTAADAAFRRALQDNIKDHYVFQGTDIKSYSKFFFDYDIRQMLEDNLFYMEYQPQYGIKEGRIVGFEALFRVKNRANILVNTFDLICYAERSGYMVLLGEFIFDTAMRFAKSVEDKNVTVSLNVSPVQLMQAGFCENFLEIYNRYNIKEGVVCVEITESFLIENFDTVVKKLEILHEHGIEVHLDDFGTRHSSLLYLKKLPVGVIKIDREFIIDVAQNELDRSITEMIVSICNTHKMHCIAEGVETRAQYDVLKEMGVDVIQGWLIGKSVPAEEATRLISEFVLK